MATTITQARPLLTAAELQLFDQSRAQPIKALTLARLRGKVTRARTLRDKYRDLYRRQTVAVRSARTTTGRSPAGGDNERTRRKAEILQEVLTRFEARLAQLEERDAREAERGQGKKAATATASSKRSRADGAAKPAGRAPASPTAKSPATSAAKSSSKSSATSAAKPLSTRASRATAQPASNAAKGRISKARGAKTEGAQPAAAGKTAEAAPEAGRASVAPRSKGARKSLAEGAAPAPAVGSGSRAKAVPSRKTASAVAASAVSPGAANGAPFAVERVATMPATPSGTPPVVPDRSTKAPSSLAPTADGKAHAPQLNAPVDLLPAALRVNPLKQTAGQMAIHAHQSSNVRRAQGKRDSR